MGSQGNAKKWKLQTISTYKRTTGDKLSGRERKQKKGTPMGVAFLPHLRTGSGSGFGEWKKKSIMAFFRLRWYWNLFEVPVSEKKKEKKLLKPSASSSFHAVFWHPVRVVLPRRERCFCLWGTYIVWRSKINDFCLYSYILTYISESNFKYFSLKSVEPMEKFPFNCCEQNEELAP